MKEPQESATDIREREAERGVCVGTTPGRNTDSEPKAHTYAWNAPAVMRSPQVVQNFATLHFRRVQNTGETHMKETVVTVVQRRKKRASVWKVQEGDDESCRKEHSYNLRRWK